jgi:hypothetical protein
MVIVKLMGGLGNQLFQYAAGRRLALARRVALKLDAREFDRPEGPTYRLGYFRIKAGLATVPEILRVVGWSGPRIRRAAFRLAQSFLPYYRRAVVWEQRRAGFHPRVLCAPGNAYLIGSWQDERYFADFADVIRDELVVKSEPDGRNRELADRIAGTESVCLHVRRGDYVTDPWAFRTLGVCGMDYYARCIARVAEQCHEPHFFVFSDEPEWARANLPLDRPATIVDHNGPERDYEDLRLMSMCRHFISANSTFSWWAAWLSRNPGKLVLAPKRWAVANDLNREGLVPAAWHRM